MEEKKRGVLEPALCAPRLGDKRSVAPVIPKDQMSKMVRGEMLYKTPNTGKQY